jgi:hypothetical protein
VRDLEAVAATESFTRAVGCDIQGHRRSWSAEGDRREQDLEAVTAAENFTRAADWDIKVIEGIGLQKVTDVSETAVAAGENSTLEGQGRR